MERAFKQICTNAVGEIETFSIISDIDSFRDIATTGHNPHRFVSFSKEKLDKGVKLMFNCFLIQKRPPHRVSLLSFYLISRYFFPLHI